MYWVKAGEGLGSIPRAWGQDQAILSVGCEAF